MLSWEGLSRGLIYSLSVISYSFFHAYTSSFLPFSFLFYLFFSSYTFEEAVRWKSSNVYGFINHIDTNAIDCFWWKRKTTTNNKNRIVTKKVPLATGVFSFFLLFSVFLSLSFLLFLLISVLFLSLCLSPPFSFFSISLYLFMYLFVYLHIFIYICTYMWISISFSLSIIQGERKNKNRQTQWERGRESNQKEREKRRRRKERISKSPVRSRDSLGDGSGKQVVMDGRGSSLCISLSAL